MNNRILELRNERRITQMALSESLNLSQKTISAYEVGRIVPSAENLIKLSNFFDVSIDYLLGRSDCRNPQPPSQLPTESLELLSIFHELEPSSRECALNSLRHLLNND